jgi:hypothetical protein
MSPEERLAKATVVIDNGATPEAAMGQMRDVIANFADRVMTSGRLLSGEDAHRGAVEVDSEELSDSDSGESWDEDSDANSDDDENVGAPSVNDPERNRAPGSDQERAARLERMMASQMSLDTKPPEESGLRTGFKCGCHICPHMSPE